MKRSLRILASVSLLAVAVNGFAAEKVKFVPALSIYVDNKGAGLRQPEGVACNDSGLVIVADSGNGRLLQYFYRSKAVEGGVEIRVPELPYPVRVQVNSKGEIFALDGKLHRVARLAPDGVFLGYLNPVEFPPPGSITPIGLAIGPGDAIYLLDAFGARVLVLDPSGKFQRQIAIPKGNGFISDLAVGSRGDIFLVDGVTATVYSSRRDAAEFTPLTKSLKAEMHFPLNITVDSGGTIFLVDQNGGGVVTVGADGAFLGRHMAFGWKEGLLVYPAQLCINSKADAFLADRGNNRVQIYGVIR